jgi:hypothetical protein
MAWEPPGGVCLVGGPFWIRIRAIIHIGGTPLLQALSSCLLNLVYIYTL